MEERFGNVEETIKRLDTLIRKEKLTDLYQAEENIKNMRTFLTQVDKEVIIYAKILFY